MIEEIFISSKDKILLGNPDLYPQNPSYPTHTTGSSQYTQLKVNNIILGILYSNIDVFIIIEYLQVLKRNLENRFNNIDEQIILDNYFIVRELFSKNCLRISEEEKIYKLPVLSTNEIFIDVIETYNAIIDKSHINCDVYGYCFVKPRFNEDNFLKLLIKKDKNIDYISNYKIVERFNKLELELNVSNKDLQILRYKAKGALPFKFTQEGDNYVLYTDDIQFDNFEVFIPISAQSKFVKLNSTKGISFYDEMKNIVKWKFKKEKICKATLNLKAEYFKNIEELRPIQISFSVTRTNKNILNIEKAICIDNTKVDVWIRYDICNGKIEIRK
jgi:hypothetical protein